MNEKRKDYLIEWRQGMWQQIRQKEDLIWRFISFFAGALVLTSGFLKISDSTGEVALTSSMFLILIMTIITIAYYGVIIVLDANFWLQRNLIFIGNIERELLDPEDFGVLLPLSYAKNKFRYSKSYETHLIFLFAVICACLLISFFFLKRNVINITPQFSSDYGFYLLVSLCFLNTILIFFTNSTNVHRIKAYLFARKNALGKEVEKNNDAEVEHILYDKEYAEKIHRKSIVFSGLTLLSLSSSFVFAYHVIKNKLFLEVFQYEFNWLPILVFFSIILLVVLMLINIVIKFKDKSFLYRIFYTALKALFYLNSLLPSVLFFLLLIPRTIVFFGSF